MKVIVASRHSQDPADMEGLAMSTAAHVPADAEASSPAIASSSPGGEYRYLTATVKIAVGLVTPLIAALAVLGAIGSFGTVRSLAVPWFGVSAWIVPVGVDIGILALLTWDLLAEYLGLSWPVLRWTAWGFIAATVYLNVAAAHGSLTGSVMHAAMPGLFVTVIDGIRHLIRQRAGLASGTRIERIPSGRWVFAPRSSFLLARRMVLWHVTSYQRGLHLEYLHLLAVSQLKETHGRWLWRWKAPLRDRLALRLRPAEAMLELTPFAQEQDETVQSGQDDRLIEAAREILNEASQDGVRLSQSALARRLRARGHRIANERLRWLAATTGLGPQGETT